MNIDLDSLKRLLVLILGFGAMFLHNKFGIELSEADIAGLAGILITFIGQSAARSIHQDKLAAAMAAAKVDSPEAAVAVLKQPPKS